MGIYDREYYRGENGGPGWFGGVAPWCKTLIVVNCVAFLLQLALGPDSPLFRDWLEASPEGIFQHGRIWQLWTATFLHANFWHILGNMWFLWLVGREMESQYGSRDFLAFYLMAAGVSTLGWALIEGFGRGDMTRPMVGASGAVMAVVTLYTLFYPRREIIFIVLPMPMWVLWAICLVFPIVAHDQKIAWEAHAMGAGFAFCYKQFDLRWTRLFHVRFPRPRFRIVSPVPVDKPRSRKPGSSRTSSEGLGAKSSAVSVLPEEQLDARLDEVLAKIAREGRSALTEEEQRVLQEASRRARDRRSDRL
ncbi:MAG: rhomboid family intramembrane serine protease [Isosphaeraceae bacterium]